MYVCLCQGVTDSQIRQAARQGCSNIRELRSRLGVASQCCKCARAAKELLSECQRENRANHWHEPVQAGARFYALG